MDCLVLWFARSRALLAVAVLSSTGMFHHLHDGIIIPTLITFSLPTTFMATLFPVGRCRFIGACFLIWASGALDPERNESGDLVTSVKRGVWAMIAVILAYCLLQAPSTKLS